MKRIAVSSLVLVALVTLFASRWRSEKTDPADGVSPEVAAPAPSSSDKAAREKPEAAAIDAFHRRATLLFEQLPRLSAPPGIGVVGASTALGNVFHALKQDPSLVAEGEVFYKECALSSELFSAVRAVCLKDLRYWSARHPSSFSEDEFPAKVRRLADVLPTPR